MTLHWNNISVFYDLTQACLLLCRMMNLTDPFGPFLFSRLHNCEWFRVNQGAQQVASSKQLLLIFLYNHVCYGSTLIGYHVTPLYPQRPLRFGCRLWLLYYWTTEVSALKSGRINSKSTVSTRKLRNMIYFSICCCLNLISTLFI